MIKLGGLRHLSICFTEWDKLQWAKPPVDSAGNRYVRPAWTQERQTEETAENGECRTWTLCDTYSTSILVRVENKSVWLCKVNDGFQVFEVLMLINTHGY